jgi:hypothetical protein
MADFKVGDRVSDSRYPRIKGTITAIRDPHPDTPLLFRRPIEVRWDDSDHRQMLTAAQIEHLSVIVRLAELVDDDV